MRSASARSRADAERTAQSITNDLWKAIALASIAEAQAATDPDRAARLLADAERAAQSITDDPEKAIALVRMAGALAATDPDRAERIAQSIAEDLWKARALARVAGHWQPPTRTVRNASPVGVDHRRLLLEGQGACQGRGGTGSHRPGPLNFSQLLRDDLEARPRQSWRDR